MKKNAKNPEKATIVFWRKNIIGSRHLIEKKIWRIPNSLSYPHGIKYRMVMVEPDTYKAVLLYDNHWPKGPHIHTNDNERIYIFENIEKLLKDFLLESKAEEKRYYESKKNCN